jgi:hypothetical protein
MLPVPLPDFCGPNGKQRTVENAHHADWRMFAPDLSARLTHHRWFSGRAWQQRYGLALCLCHATIPILLWPSRRRRACTESQLVECTFHGADSRAYRAHVTELT